MKLSKEGNHVLVLFRGSCARMRGIAPIMNNDLTATEN